MRLGGVASAGQLADRERWDSYSVSPPLKLQRSLSSALLGAARTRWLAHAPPEAAAVLHSSSGWSAGAALLYPLTERVLQLPDATVMVAVRERLGLPLAPSSFCPRVFNSGRVCNAPLRGGAHAHCCSELSFFANGTFKL